MPKEALFSIKPLSPDDTAAVSGLAVKPAQRPFILSPSAALNLILELGLSETSRPYIVMVGDRPAGFFTLNFFSPALGHYVKNDRECGLQAFMIDQRYQRKGYGRQAVMAAISLISTTMPKIDFIKLAVNLHNKAAISLYLGCGFEDTGETYTDGLSGTQYIYVRSLKGGTANQ